MGYNILWIAKIRYNTTKTLFSEFRWYGIVLCCFSDVMDRFYSLSYLWYSATAMIVVIGVGMTVSAITGKPYVNASTCNKAGYERTHNFFFANKGMVMQLCEKSQNSFLFLHWIWKIMNEIGGLLQDLRSLVKWIPNCSVRYLMCSVHFYRRRSENLLDLEYSTIRFEYKDHRVS